MKSNLFLTHPVLLGTESLVTDIVFHQIVILKKVSTITSNKPMCKVDEKSCDDSDNDFSVLEQGSASNIMIVMIIFRSKYHEVLEWTELAFYNLFI